MNKILLSLSAFALALTLNAQNTWTGSTAQTTTTGAVGIGTFNPQQLLHVYSGTSDAQIATESVNHSSIRFTKSGTGSWMSGLQFDDGLPKFCINNSSTFDATPEFTVLPNGNVGINVISPTAKFHSNGTVRFQGIGETAGYVLTSDALGNATWQASNWIATGSDISHSGGNVGVVGGNMIIDHIVSINYQGGIASLHNPMLIFEGGVIDGSLSLINPPNEPDYMELTGKDFRVSENMNIQKKLNVAGSFTVGQLFKVNIDDGVTYAKTIKVTALPFPDYVFEKEYKLMPLPELEKYIVTNKHLPNINTAADVKENGLSLGEMQVKQMEKIEELTLYIFEMNKKLEAQQKKIDSLIK